MLIKTLIPKMEIRTARLYVSERTRPLTQAEMETRALSYMLKDALCTQDRAGHRGEGDGGADQRPVHAGARAQSHRRHKRKPPIVSGHCGPGRRRGPSGRHFGKAQAVDSSCKRHKAGRPTVDNRGSTAFAVKGKKNGCDQFTWFVDNTTTTGTTLEACKAAMGGFGCGLTFTDAWQSVCLRDLHLRKAS